VDNIQKVQRGEGQAYRDNSYFQKELDQSKVVLNEANKSIEETAQPQAEEELGNREALHRSFTGQGNERALNQAKEAGRNFDIPQAVAPADGKAAINDAWLAKNSLENASPDISKMPALGRLIEGKKERSAAGKDFDGDQPSAPEIAQSELKKQIVAEGDQQMAQQFRPQQSQETKEVVKRYQEKLKLSQSETGDAERGRVSGISAGTRVYDIGALTTNVPDFQGPTSELQGMPATGLASLDVELPRRGTRYQFTTPRGEVVITARPISRKLLDALAPLGIVVFAGIVVTAFRRLRGPMGRITLETQSMVSTIVIVLGVLGLLFGIFPVLGLAAVVASIVWKVRVRRARRRAAAA
jgi:hypothetical protein